MNKIGAAVGGTTVKELIGSKKKCFDFFRTSDCKTQKCACSRAMTTNQVESSETDAHPGSLNLDIQYTATPIIDRTGKIIGAFENVVDLTALKTAAKTMNKIAQFQDVEVAKLNGNLLKLAQGDMGIDLEVGQADNDTQIIREKFLTISSALGKSVDAVRSAHTRCKHVI